MSALKTITTRAKQIYKKGGTWKAAIKKAGAEYRGKKKSVKRKPAKKAAKRKTVRRRRISGTLSDSPRPAGGAIGRVSAASLISHAKEKIGHEIARAELSRFKAVKKSAKKKAAKRIAVLKSKYRKLC